MKVAADAALAPFERRLGHRFAKRELLVTALTHSGTPGGDTYQRQEFLGDRVLGLVIAEMLLAAFPTESEGALNSRFVELVRRETCAEIAISLDLGSAIRFAGARSSRTALLTTNVLCDACEAVIAAIYQDGGLEAARRFIEANWRSRVSRASVPDQNAKAALQEWAQGEGLGVPTYVIAAKSGPDHEPSFEVEARVAKLETARGKGRTRRDAEQAAASALLTREGVWKAKP